MIGGDGSLLCEVAWGGTGSSCSIWIQDAAHSLNFSLELLLKGLDQMMLLSLHLFS